MSLKRKQQQQCPKSTKRMKPETIIIDDDDDDMDNVNDKEDKKPRDGGAVLVNFCEKGQKMMIASLPVNVDEVSRFVNAFRKKQHVNLLFDTVMPGCVFRMVSIHQSKVVILMDSTPIYIFGTSLVDVLADVLTDCQPRWVIPIRPIPRLIDCKNLESLLLRSDEKRHHEPLDRVDHRLDRPRPETTTHTTTHATVTTVPTLSVDYTPLLVRLMGRFTIRRSILAQMLELPGPQSALLTIDDQSVKTVKPELTSPPYLLVKNSQPGQFMIIQGDSIYAQLSRNVVSQMYSVIERTKYLQTPTINN